MIRRSEEKQSVRKPAPFNGVGEITVRSLPNTAQEIEAAQHISELPNTGRTSITVLGAVRGVGGIDSWGTDVEKPYHIPGDRDHSVSFRIVF